MQDQLIKLFVSLLNEFINTGPCAELYTINANKISEKMQFIEWKNNVLDNKQLSNCVYN